MCAIYERAYRKSLSVLSLVPAKIQAFAIKKTVKNLDIPEVLMIWQSVGQELKISFGLTGKDGL